MRAKTHSKTRTKTEDATLKELKRKLIVANHILDSENLATPFGHISVRVPGTENFLITRSVAPGEATREDIVVCDREGKIIEGKYRDTYSEVVIHSEVFKVRKEFASVIHFHSTHVIALSMAGATVLPANLQMTTVGLEPIAVYDSMLFVNRPALGAKVARLLGPNKAVILKAHGAVACGHCIEDAIYTALTLERSAMFQWMARCLGSIKPVSAQEKKELAKYHRSLLRPGHGGAREWAYFEWKQKQKQ